MNILWLHGERAFLSLSQSAAGRTFCQPLEIMELSLSMRKQSTWHDDLSKMTRMAAILYLDGGYRPRPRPRTSSRSGS